MILKARLVLPVTGPPVRNGVIRITRRRIEKIAPASEFSAKPLEKVIDLQDSILLPGLINAHCHLDYTLMAGMIPFQRRFTDWIKLMTATKAAWSYSEFADSWLSGARMLVERGTTTVADIEVCPELLPEVWSATPLRVHSFLEMTGVKSRRNPKAILDEAVSKIESLPSGRNRAGLSPHAPYSTTPELLRLTARAAHERNWRVTTHVAESGMEYQMFATSSGEMLRWLARNDRDNSDCGLGTPVQHLERNGLLSQNLIAVHANCLDPADVSLLARHNVNVVHCPRSHQFFQHPPFEYESLTSAGVNVCLGTDSLASIPASSQAPPLLDMFAEMAAFKNKHPSVSAETILQMATINSARALGMEGALGEIRAGAFADLIAIPFAGDEQRPYDAVIQHRGPVRATLIDGDWIARE